MRLFVVAFVLLCTAAAEGVPDSVIKLARLKRQMADVLNHMPDYTCLVTLQRGSGPRNSVNFLPADTIHYEVAHADGRELFAWPGATHFEDQSVVETVRYGVISNGEFAAHARTVFLGGYSTIKYFGAVDLDGHESLRWDYVVPLFGSGWRVTHYNRVVTVGSRGSFWVDPATLDLLRLEVRADGIPPDFPFTDASDTIDYSRIKIGFRNVLLPQTATVVLDEPREKESRNVLEFSHCRQYLGESAISFDVPETAIALPPSAFMSAAHPADFALPTGLSIRLQLSAAIDSTTAVIGDLLEATVATDVIQRGKVVVPAGSQVHGRLRRIEHRNGSPGQCGIDVEFNEILISGKRVRFFANMTKLEKPFAGFVAIGHPGLFRDERGTATALYYTPAIPGVATFLVKGAAFRLPEGMTMLWVTGSAGSRHSSYTSQEH